MKLNILIPVATALVLIVDTNWVTAQTRPKIAEVSRGTVELKRGSGEYRSASVGVELFSGDLVKVRRGETAEIRCTLNRTTWQVPDNNVPWGVANVCPSPASSQNPVNATFQSRLSSFLRLR